MFLHAADLVVELGGGRLPADGGRRDAASAPPAVLVVVGQRQAQQAGAGGQVHVLDVLHLRTAHGTQLRGGRDSRVSKGKSKVAFRWREMAEKSRV